MRLILCFAIACGAGRVPAPPPQPVHNTAAPAANAPALGDRAAVIMAALARYAADPKTLSDADLVEPNRIVLVEGAAIVLPAPWIAMRPDEVIAAADRAHHQIGVIHVYQLTITGDHAEIFMGGDIVLPSDSKGIKLCCCEAMDGYVKRAGAWRFEQRTGEMCS